ncbi:MAG: hypothetical protein L0216_17085 [Planctomycetales bacterium]|nr:hypothetical protein [Planctomycetales bacterium]
MRRTATAIAGLSLLALLASLVPGLPAAAPPGVATGIRLGLFALLAGAWHVRILLTPGLLTPRQALASLPVVPAVAILREAAQRLLPGHSASVGDLLLDLVAIAAGLVAAALLARVSCFLCTKNCEDCPATRRMREALEVAARTRT